MSDSVSPPLNSPAEDIEEPSQPHDVTDELTEAQKLVLQKSTNTIILDGELIQLGLCSIEPTADGISYAPTKFICNKKSLTDVTALQKFIFLRYINIAFNELTNLVPLENLHNLLVLNASYNHITEFPLGKWPALTHLYLNHNRITELREMNMPRLQLLSLNNNQLTKLFNTSNGEPFLNGRDLPELHTLELAHNKLYLLDKASPDDLGAPVSLKIQLPKLKALFLNHNALTSLATYKLYPRIRPINTLDELPADEEDEVSHKQNDVAKPSETEESISDANNQGESTELASPVEEQVVEEEEGFVWIREESGSALGDLPQLSVLSLRANGLLDLDGLTYKAVPKLQYLNLRENVIGLLDEVNKLMALPRLQTLILLGK
ncbi:hypothetical protein PHET_10915 [Paragonimus heterotremus]|uniref:Leucine-rich repeat-containing protein 23 n=1 Tax=Paragonimus heterotremus TaxID=100268 RepID=A0A8J4SZ88_9TREM|nr:hypothetical protein PHET_10915 [Paragonimus heterotremus]